MIIMVDHIDLGAALTTPGTHDVGELPWMSDWMRRGSLVEVARKSREPNVMRLPRAKLSPPVKAEMRAIRVEDVTWHSSSPLPVAPTIMVLETRGLVRYVFGGDASTNSL
jgi:hypothetical protein